MTAPSYVIRVQTIPVCTARSSLTHSVQRSIHGAILVIRARPSPVPSVMMLLGLKSLNARSKRKHSSGPSVQNDWPRSTNKLPVTGNPYCEASPLHHLLFTSLDCRLTLLSHLRVQPRVRSKRQSALLRHLRGRPLLAAHHCSTCLPPHKHCLPLLNPKLNPTLNRHRAGSRMQSTHQRKRMKRDVHSRKKCRRENVRPPAWRRSRQSTERVTRKWKRRLLSGHPSLSARRSWK